MKDTIYPHISALITISLNLCEKITSFSFPVPRGTVTDSEAYRDNCIEETEKAFLPPLDREDVVYVALRLHRLNTRLYTLARLTENRGKDFDFSETAHFLEHTKTVCSRLSEIMEQKFKGNRKSRNTPLPSSFTAAFPRYNNKYNFYSVIADYTLFRIASECSDEAELILDYTVRTLIKNS